MLFRARERLVHQRTELVTALRGVLCERGRVVPQGNRHLGPTGAVFDDPRSDLPTLVHEECRDLKGRIAEKAVRSNRSGCAKASGQGTAVKLSSLLFT